MNGLRDGTDPIERQTWRSTCSTLVLMCTFEKSVTIQQQVTLESRLMCLHRSSIRRRANTWWTRPLRSTKRLFCHISQAFLRAGCNGKYCPRPVSASRLFWLKWLVRLYNILDHKNEQDHVLYEDPDPDTGFMILPDMKWDGKTMSALVNRGSYLRLSGQNAQTLP
jgi:hypothetical protein